MTKDFRNILSELNDHQRKGIDQTNEYNLLFNGATKIVEMAKINAIKEKVQRGAFYLSRKKSAKADEYLVVDMYKGHIYKINSKNYKVEVVNDNILATNNITGEEYFLITKGKLDFGEVKHLGIKNYTYGSGGNGFKGIPLVRFDNDYKESIRVHWIIAMMKYGIVTINKCVSDSTPYKLRHKIAYKKSKENSIYNLHIVKDVSDDRYLATL